MGKAGSNDIAIARMADHARSMAAQPLSASRRRRDTLRADPGPTIRVADPPVRDAGHGSTAGRLGAAEARSST
eukprot:13250553-Heterocapsa_arctica.AAC.1